MKRRRRNESREWLLAHTLDLIAGLCGAGIMLFVALVLVK